MDPASIAGLFLQTSQLAFSSGTALYQFVQDAKKVNAHVEDLSNEFKSLGRTCRHVHGQLRSLAKHYDCHEQDGDDDVSLWSSIQSELAGCNATLQKLKGALEGFGHGGSNLFTQGLCQFKLNLKQHEIIAMKGRVQSHTSALQVCLLVMDM
jgi:hypothetical protein